MQHSAKFLVAALLALSPAAHPALREFALAQVAQAPTFSLPETVPSDTALSIQSSPNLGYAADALKQEFEAAYDGTEVGVEVTSSDEAIAALLDDDIDLAAIGRPLTEAERGQDLNTVALERAKIAVIIGPGNPFEGNLTFEQFAAMFRGEITDWSEVGGQPGPIRFVDRPEDSDTRRSLSQYEVFRSAAFEPGATTEQLAEDDTAAVVQALGNDGIGYAIAPHVLDQPGVTIVPMHQTLPDDPRYPYSQPRYFVYRGEPSPAVAAFLGYATSAAGATALTAAQVAEAGAAAASITAPVDPVAEAAPADPAAQAPAETAPAETVPAETDNDGGFAWWWLLLPLLALGGLAWLLGRGRSGLAPGAVAGDGAIAPPAPEPPLPPTVEPAVVPPVVEPAPKTIVEEEFSPAPEPVSAPPVFKPAAIPAALGVAGLAGAAAASLASTEDRAAVEASKFNVVGRPTDGDLDLSTIDDGLPPLPDGYGDSRIVLMARDPQWAYAYWDTPHTHKEELRRQGGEQLALRLYDVTGINLDDQAPHSLQQVGCDEIAREWYMQIPVGDRDYQVEIGYLAGDGRWLVLARSNTIRIPPVYPSDWTEEHFLTVAWEDNLRGKTIMTLVDPHTVGADAGLHEQLYALSHAGEALRVDGSLFGSMQQVPGAMAPPVSSFIFPSGAGVSSLTMSGVSGFTLSGFPGPAAEFPGLTMSGVSGLTMSGFSGLTMSGVGLGIRPRKFWLVADAELIVYGATEPDATVTVAGVPIELSEDGTFRFHQSFQDGSVDYPIMAVAADGEQNRNVHLTFERRTPDRNTNTKDEAQEEWPNGEWPNS